MSDLISFLENEYTSYITEEEKKFDEAIKNYYRHFQEYPPTEGMLYTLEEKTRMLTECVRLNINIWNMMGEENDPNVEV